MPPQHRQKRAHLGLVDDRGLQLDVEAIERQRAALLDDGLETGTDIVVEDDVGSVPQRDVVDSVSQRGVARRRQGRWSLQRARGGC